MSASNVKSSSTPTATTSASLRPRTRRLISGLDEGDEVNFDPATAPNIRIASPVPSLLDNRSISPIPQSHLPRPASSYDRKGGTHANALSGKERGTGVRGLTSDSSTTSLERLWGTSWTTIQGIASDLLGSSAQDAASISKGKTSRRRNGNNTHRHATSAPSTWGPSTSATINDVGTGTREETETAFRARKRLDLLTRQETSLVDSLGHYKRRTSDEAIGSHHEEQHSRDALVYLHNVQHGDTLAGITLKYDCSANTIRRTNRMWPNDLVQSRTTLLLPVDACGVKGRPVDSSDDVDLLGDENAPMPAGLAETPTTSLSVVAKAHNRDRSNSNLTSTTDGRSSSMARSVATSETSWHHDSWVLLPGTTKPTEIVRLSRQSLGYFPPARRKSQTFSDLDSPKSSFDRPRSLVAEALKQTSQSPARASSSHRLSTARRLSNMPTNSMPSFLQGPGGVGTMDRSVHAPGPAPDSLNLYFAKHLPDVAPPRNQHSLYQPDMPLTADDLTPTPSGTSTPSAGTNKNFEHMGSAIESWMRRVASKAKEATTPAERQRAARASVGAPGKGAGGIGDLIEMTNEFEIGDDDYHEEIEHSRGRASFLDGSTSSAAAYTARTAKHRSTAKSGKAD